MFGNALTIVSNLEAVGLLVRRPHPEHGRVLQAFVTSQGENLLQEGHRRVRAIEEQMVTSLQPDELKQFMKVLQICTNALEKHNSENSMEPQKGRVPLISQFGRLGIGSMCHFAMQIVHPLLSENQINGNLNLLLFILEILSSFLR